MIFYKNIRTYIKRFKNEVILRPIVICRGSKKEKGVCLTFDDGPNPNHTVRILDILDDFSAKATFFLVGKNIQKYRSLFHQIVNRGHQVCNHTMTHKVLWRASWLDIKTEIDQCDKLLRSNINYNSKYFRPPKGAIGIKLILYALLFQKNLVLWSIDLKDYQTTEIDKIASFSESLLLHPGDILLLHDTTLTSEFVLETILKKIQISGLKTLTLNEILEN